MSTAHEIDRPPPAPLARGWRMGPFRHAALIANFVVFVAFASFTWERWGNLQIDCGREMYVPAAIRAGKMLHRDIWYQYGPLAPYWHSFLYSVFGERLLTLYFSGLAITLSFAITLFTIARRLLPEIAAFVVSFCFFVRAFQPGFV